MRMGKILISFSCFVFCLSLNPACKTQDQGKWAGKILEQNGYILVENPSEPIYSDKILELKEELSFGGKTDQEEEYFWERLTQIEIDSRGRIYTLDIRSKKIHVFGESGNYQHSIGRFGQGPGEYQYPWCIDVYGKDNIAVLDFSRRSLLCYTPQGNFDKKADLSPYGTCQKFVLNPSGKFIGQFSSRAVESLKIIDLENKDILVAAEKKYEKTPLLRAISPKLIWNIFKGDQILWGISDKYLINVCDDKGRVIRKITKPYKRIKIPPDEMEDYQNNVQRLHGGREIPPTFEQELPEYYPVFQAFYTDDTGRIFVKTYEKSENGGFIFDIFDPDGKYLARTAFQTEYQIWRGNNMYTIEKNSDGYPVIKHYHVDWKY